MGIFSDRNGNFWYHRPESVMSHDLVNCAKEQNDWIHHVSQEISCLTNRSLLCEKGKARSFLLKYDHSYSWSEILQNLIKYRNLKELS